MLEEATLKELAALARFGRIAARGRTVPLSGAALLDERRFREWLDLLAEDIEYTLDTNTLAQFRDRRKGWSPPSTYIFHEDKYQLERRVRASKPGRPGPTNPPAAPVISSPTCAFWRRRMTSWWWAATIWPIAPPIARSPQLHRHPPRHAAPHRRQLHHRAPPAGTGRVHPDVGQRQHPL
jgi:hypothetical protein